MSASDIPLVVQSILKRKSNVGGYVDMSRHTIENQSNPDDLSVSMSIVKHNKIPASQAVAVSSKQKLIGTSLFHPSREERVTDIVCQNATVSKTARPSKKRQQKKYPFDGPVYDAQYREMVDDVIESSKKYKTVEPKDARNLVNKGRNYKGKLRDDYTNEFVSDKWGDDKDAFINCRNVNKSRERELNRLEKSLMEDYQRGSVAKDETSDFAIISKQKRQIKENLKTKPVNNVSAADAFDYLVDTFKGKNKSGKPTKEEVQIAPQQKRHSLKSNIVRGIQDINEITDEISKNGNLQRIKQQKENDIKALRSANRHLKSSIAACANSKKGLTVGSLVKQHNLTTNNTTTTTNYTGSSSNLYGVTARYEKGLGDHRIELHYYYGNKRITHTQVERVLTKKQIHNLKNEAKNAIFGRQTLAFNNTASPTTAQANQTVNNTPVGNQRTKTLNKPKTATRSGLVRRNKSEVV